MSGQRKRPRWESILHEGGISLSGLQALVRKLGDHKVSTKTLRHANATLFNRVSVVEMLECVDAPPFAWNFADPNLLLVEMVIACPALQEVFASAARIRNRSMNPNPYETHQV